MMNIKNTFIVISGHLFRKGPRPLVTVSTAVITVLHSTDVVHFTVSRDYPYARGGQSPKHSQVEQAGFTMKPFKGSSNKLGPLGFISQSV
jgi:hypothetical protein